MICYGFVKDKRSAQVDEFQSAEELKQQASMEAASKQRRKETLLLRGLICEHCFQFV